MVRPSSQPSTSGSSVHSRLRQRIAGTSNLALHAQWMVHVKSCTVEDQTCSLSCNLQKAALLHMENCTNGSPCEFQYCDTTRNIIAHWQTCKQGKSCGICAPLLTTPYPLPSTSSQNSGKAEPPTVAELAASSFAKAVAAVNRNGEVEDAAAKKKKKKKTKTKVEPLTPASVAYAGWTPAHKRFVLLEHVIWCKNDHKPGPRPLAHFSTPPYTRPTPVPPPCTYAHCAAMQELLDHCAQCPLNSGCNFAHCATTKFLIVHIARCPKTKECGFCNSLNKSLTEYDWQRRFQSVPPEIEEWSLKTDERRFLMKVKPSQYPGVSILDGYEANYPSKGPYDARQDAHIRMVSWILETTIATQTMNIDHAGHCKDENCQRNKCAAMKQTLKHMSTCYIEGCTFDTCHATKTIMTGWMKDGTAILMPSLQYIINAYLPDPDKNPLGRPATMSSEASAKQLRPPPQSKQPEKTPIIADPSTWDVQLVDDAGQPYSSAEMIALTDADSTAVVKNAHRLLADMRTAVARTKETGIPSTTPEQRSDIAIAVAECASALRARQMELRVKAAKSEERAKRREAADAWKAEARLQAEADAAAIKMMQDESEQKLQQEFFLQQQREIARQKAAGEARKRQKLAEDAMAAMAVPREIPEDEFARMQRRVQEQARKGGFSKEEREFVMSMDLPNANLPSKDNLMRCFREGSALAAAATGPLPSYKEQRVDFLRMMQDDMRSGGDNSFMHPDDLEKFLAIQFLGSASTAANGSSPIVATITPELLSSASATSTAEFIRQAQPDLPEEMLDDVTAALQELMTNGGIISEEWCKSHGFPDGSSSEFNSKIILRRSGSIGHRTPRKESVTSTESAEHRPGRRKSEGDQPDYLHLCPKTRSRDSERSGSPSYSYAEIALLMDPEQQERLLVAIANGDGHALELAGLKELAEAEGPRAAYERCHKVRMQMEILKNTGDEAKLKFVEPMFNLLEHDITVEGNKWRARSDAERRAREALAKMEAEEEDEEYSTTDEEAEKEEEREERRLDLQSEMDREMVRELDAEQTAMDGLFLIAAQLANLVQIHEMAAGGLPLGALEDGIRDARRKIGAYPEPPTKDQRAAATAHFSEALARLGQCDRTREMEDTRKADEVYLQVRREQIRVIKRRLEREELSHDELEVCKARIQLAMAECGQRMVEVDTRHTDAPFVAEKWMAENLPGAEGKSAKEVRQMMDDYIEREQKRMDDERRREVEESKRPIIKLLKEYLARREAAESEVKIRQDQELEQEIAARFKKRNEEFAKIMDQKLFDVEVSRWIEERAEIKRSKEEQWERERVERGHAEPGTVVALLEFVQTAEGRLWAELNTKIGGIAVGASSDDDALAKELILVLFEHIKSMGAAAQAEVEAAENRKKQEDSEDSEDDSDDDDSDPDLARAMQDTLMELLNLKPNGNEPPIDLDTGGPVDLRARILSKAVDLEREERKAKRAAVAEATVIASKGFGEVTRELEASRAKLLAKTAQQPDGDELASELLGAQPSDLQGALFRVMQAKLDGTDTPIDEKEARLLEQYQKVDAESNEAAEIRKQILMNAVEHEKAARMSKKRSAIMKKEDEKKTAAAMSRKDQLMAQARALEEENRVLEEARNKLMKIDQYRKEGQAYAKMTEARKAAVAAKKTSVKPTKTTSTMTSTTERDIEAQVLKRISELEVAPVAAPVVVKKKADVRKAREAELARVRAAMKAGEVAPDGSIVPKSAKTEEKKEVLTQQKADIAREIEQSLQAKEAAAAAAKKKDEGKIVIDERSRIMMNAIDQEVARQRKREEDLKAGIQPKTLPNAKPVAEKMVERQQFSAEQKQLMSTYQTRLLNTLNANRPEGQRSSEEGQSEKEKMIDFLAMIHGAKMAGRWVSSKSHEEKMKVDRAGFEEFKELMKGMGCVVQRETYKADGSASKRSLPQTKDYIKEEFTQFAPLFYEDPFRPISDSMPAIREWMNRKNEKAVPKTTTKNLDEHIERLVSQHMADVWAGRRPPLHSYKDTMEITTRYNAILEEIARDPKKQKPPRPMADFIQKREADLARAMIKKELYAAGAFLTGPDMIPMTREQCEAMSMEERKARQLARIDQICAAACPPELRQTAAAPAAANGVPQRSDDEIENDILASKLMHAKFCRESPCNYCDCAAVKDLFNHLVYCTDMVCTSNKLCVRARSIFRHWAEMHKCTIRVCAVCRSIRGREHLLREFVLVDSPMLVHASQYSLAAQLCFIGQRSSPYDCLSRPVKASTTR